MPAQSNKLKIATALAVVGILLVAFDLRTYHLAAKDIWVDEAHPWYFATLPLVESLNLGFSGGPINSGADPLYNILLHFWIKLAGDKLYAMRLFSTLTNLLGVALLGRVARRAFGLSTMIVALGVGAIAPIWVFYAQEMRPYAFTPALMLLMIDPVITLTHRGPRRIKAWIMLMVAEVLAIFAHGFMLFAVVGINGWLAVEWIRRRHKPNSGVWLRNWVLGQLGAGLLLIPIISLNLARAGGIQNPFATPRTAPEFANELWMFLMGIPWEQVLNPTLLRVLLAIVLVGVGLGLVVALRREPTRQLTDVVWLTLGLSLLTGLYVWRDPSFHPRYALFISSPLFLLVSAVGVRLWESSRGWRCLGVGLGTLLIITSAISLDNLYEGNERGYRHPSTQVVAATLRDEFGANDAVVVVAPHDFTLHYNGTGVVPIGWSRFDEGIDQPADVMRFLTGKQKIGVLRNTNERSDSRRILPFYLERYGSLDEHRFFEGYDLAIYHFDPGALPQLAEFEPASFDWSVLSINGVSIASGDAITVALQWRANSSYQPGTRYAASIRLVDPVTQWVISGADSLLLDGGGSPTDRWQPGLASEQYFVLPLQPGTPPIDAELQVSLYEVSSGHVLDLRDTAGAPAGQQATVGIVKIGPAPLTFKYDDDARLWRLQPIESPSLTGFVADKSVIAPGGSLGVTLAWAIPPDEVASQAIIQIVQDGVVIAEDSGKPLQGRMTADVSVGQMWLDRRLLSVSGGAHTGAATLQVQLGHQVLTLAELEVVGFERITQRPPIQHPFEMEFQSGVKLLGYELNMPDPLTSSSTVEIKLFWQALADGLPDAQYKVFTQILAEDGHLVGQHDGMPDLERRPFSGWLNGEFVIDTHLMIFIESYVGPIHIQIGLYDPVTLTRVLTVSGSDAVVLPERFVVESGP